MEPGVRPMSPGKVKTAGKRFLPPVTLKKNRAKKNYNALIFLDKKREFFYRGIKVFISNTGGGHEGTP